MISGFGAVSLAVLVLCVTGLVLHYRIMKIRMRLDDAENNLETLLRDEFEIIFDPTDGEWEGDDIHGLLRIWQDRRLAENTEGDGDARADILNEALRQYSAAAAVYNAHITRFPGILMAMALSLTPVQAPAPPP